MSDSPWTPGPWFVEYGQQVMVTPNRDGCHGAPWCKHFWPEYEADARLIAAAPELADLLAQARDELEDADSSLQMEFGTGPPVELPILKTIDGLFARIRGEA